MCNLKTVLSILLIQGAISGYCCLSLSLQDSNTNTTELKFKRLRDCLTSSGVNDENIIKRDSGNNYTELNWQWNTLNDNLTPMAYLVANDDSDVQNAVLCCNLLNIRIVPRSGGHSLVKNCFGDNRSLVIDLARLNQISVDPIKMTCEIGAGARAGLIKYKLWAAGEFMIPMGICPTVAVTGLTLGGGYGYFTRELGLTLDNLIELEMVNAKGQSLVINNSTNEDLFWALRGAGGGTFGIVTKLRFRIYSAPKSITYGVYIYDFDDFPQFFEAWQSLTTTTLPNKISTLLVMKKNVIEMRIFNFNFEKKRNTAMDFERLLNSFSFPNTTKSSRNLMSYPEFVLTTSQSYSTTSLKHLSQLAQITKHVDVARIKIKSIYVDKILGKKKILKLKLLLNDYLSWSGLYMELNGGAINKFSKTETAFIHRGENLYHIQLESAGIDGVESNFQAKNAAMKTLYEDSKKIFSHRESYQNYLDQDMPDYLERYYGTNLKKLIQVKMRHDPENVFRHPQSIPVNLEYIKKFQNVNGYDFM